jgi:hypothetical protein
MDVLVVHQTAVAEERGRVMQSRQHEGMTPREAREILKTPVFGDENCIRARDVLMLSAEVKRYRDAWKSARGSESFHEYCDGAVSTMSESRLRAELERWARWSESS